MPDTNAMPGSGGVSGPIGLGFRVPTFVISPYSRGTRKCSTVLDHPSQLTLLRTRFGVPVPEPGRDQTVGEMTNAFNFAVPPNAPKPNLKRPVLGAIPKLPQCVPNAILGSTVKTPIPYRVSYPQTMPAQETAPARGIC